MLSFKPTFSLSFTFIKRLFSSSLSSVRVVSSAYLSLLIFLPAVLIPAFASSSPVFLMMYFAYKLNKQGDSIQPWHTPFPIWNHSGSNCCLLICIQISQEAGKVVWYSHLEGFSSLLWSTQSKTWKLYSFLYFNYLEDMILHFGDQNQGKGFWILKTYF